MGRHTIKAGAAFYIYRKNENQLADNAGSFTFANTPRPNANVTLEQAWANFLLGNVATRLPGQTLEWDAENLRVTNSEAATKLLTKNYREGWKLEAAG